MEVNCIKRGTFVYGTESYDLHGENTTGTGEENFMKKRIVRVLGLVAITGGLFLAAYTVNTKDIETGNPQAQQDLPEYVQDKEPQIDGLYYEDKEELQSAVEGMDQDDIFETGENVIITNDEIEQYEEFYHLAKEDDAKECAEQYARERKALYAEAMKNGYDVTDKEIKEYLIELKDTLKTTMGENEYKELYESYGSEEDYWDYEYEVYKINLPIQKYVSDMETSYKKKHCNIEDDLILDHMWSDEFENLKSQLVEKQNFIID